MTILDRYAELHARSAALHVRALASFPDGVTHDMRHASPFPLYVDRAEGSRKWDVDGNELIDYVMGHGSLLLGHNRPEVVEAVRAQIGRGTHYGASHEMEIRWAELVRQLVPSAEQLRFTSSGTEATMMALRLARAATGREKIIRLRENFHGWNDSVTGQPGPEETLPAASPGLPRGILDASIVLPQNDVQALEHIIADDGDTIAAMIFEATGAHFGSDPLDLDYVKQARELTASAGIVFIMDEVITGFRVTPGGAQVAYGVTPDMTTMAKILGGGLPGGAVAGSADLLGRIAIGEGSRYSNGGRVAHPGTYNANPLSAAAGATCLHLISDGAHQQRAADTATSLARRMNAAFRDASVPGAVYGASSMLHIALGMASQPPDGYSWGWNALPERPPAVPSETAAAFRRGMINLGVDLMGPGLMVSSAHTDDDVDYTVAAFRDTLGAMRAEGLLR